MARMLREFLKSGVNCSFGNWAPASPNGPLIISVDFQKSSKRQRTRTDPFYKVRLTLRRKLTSDPRIERSQRSMILKKPIFGHWAVRRQTPSHLKNLIVDFKRRSHPTDYCIRTSDDNSIKLTSLFLDDSALLFMLSRTTYLGQL
jgi:hypothetical protein